MSSASSQSIIIRLSIVMQRRASIPRSKLFSQVMEKCDYSMIVQSIQLVEWCLDIPEEKFTQFAMNRTEKWIISLCGIAPPNVLHSRSTTADCNTVETAVMMAATAVAISCGVIGGRSMAESAMWTTSTTYGGGGGVRGRAWHAASMNSNWNICSLHFGREGMNFSRSEI